MHILPTFRFLSVQPTPVLRPFNSPSIGGHKSCTEESASSLVEQDRKIEGTQTYFEETRHGLISTANLHLEEGCLSAIAILCGALYFALLRVVPSSRATKDILPLLALEVAAREQRFGNSVLVRTCAALEAVVAVFHGRDGQDIGAVGADWKVVDQD